LFSFFLFLSLSLSTHTHTHTYIHTYILVRHDLLNTHRPLIGTAGVVEGYTLKVAIDAVRTNAANSQMNFWEYVRKGDNPIPVAVMLEDGAAVAGVIVAGTGITLTHITGNVMYDAAGTIAVGTLLGGVAMMLITKNRAMLVGRSIDRRRLNQLKQVLMKDDVIDSLHDVKCISVGPSDVRFKAEINFNGWRIAEKYIDKKIDLSDAKGKLKRTSDIELFLLLFGDGLVQMLGDEIDRIEEIVRDHIPEAKHVDIEVL
jgi:solute carrier family 30 (zinc transporter), member 9